MISNLSYAKDYCSADGKKISITLIMPKLEITEEMLDVIEVVKGTRDPAYWDGRCKSYLQKQKIAKKDAKITKKG